MAGRIHQLFGNELADRLHRAALDAGENELVFVRRMVDEALPERGAASACSRMRFALGFLVGVLVQSGVMLLLS